MFNGDTPWVQERENGRQELFGDNTDEEIEHPTTNLMKSIHRQEFSPSKNFHLEKHVEKSDAGTWMTNKKTGLMSSAEFKPEGPDPAERVPSKKMSNQGIQAEARKGEKAVQSATVSEKDLARLQRFDSDLRKFTEEKAEFEKQKAQFKTIELEKAKLAERETKLKENNDKIYRMAEEIKQKDAKIAELLSRF